ncbi:unnamed protein product [Brugia pahangi]|uniref:LLM class flavin-dependent oxidoreductase n=1 Tax=Brugia pahangi TaxID=6280 RepID=A0A0N4T698_BRUPA|nr:unnamed protein product [Brugia pahangi]
MQALEPFPPVDDVKLMGPSESYKFAEKKLNEIMEEGLEAGCVGMGTLSQDEWEIASMYLVFAFQREKNV